MNRKIIAYVCALFCVTTVVHAQDAPYGNPYGQPKDLDAIRREELSQKCCKETGRCCLITGKCVLLSAICPFQALEEWLQVSHECVSATRKCTAAFWEHQWQLAAEEARRNRHNHR